MSVYSDINELSKCIDTICYIDSGIISYIKSKNKIRKIINRLENCNIFELCSGYVYYNINKYEITDNNYVSIIPYKVMLHNKCLKILTKDFTLTYTNDTFNVYTSYSHDITNFSVSNNVVIPDRISGLWEIVSDEMREIIINDIKHH